MSKLNEECNIDISAIKYNLIHAEIHKYFHHCRYIEKVCSQASIFTNFPSSTAENSREIILVPLHWRSQTQEPSGWNFDQNPLSWISLFFLVIKKILISKLFLTSLGLHLVKAWFALNTINLIPTIRVGVRILGEGSIFSKIRHFYTLKHLLCSVFGKFFRNRSHKR